jgi:hypothetical protein
VTIYLIMGTLLVALVYFALCATGFAMLFSPIVGLLGFGFFRLIDPTAPAGVAHFRMGLATGLGTIMGLALAVGLGITSTPVWDGLGVILSVLTAAAVYTLASRGSSEPCQLCKTPMRGGGFDCPRCSDRVCARPTCWNAKHARCARCHDRDVVIFPIAERWWDARVGRRVMKGECSSCYKEAHDANLRECGQCHWPMCQRCWDYYNGVCQRCEWTIPDLPPQLQPFIVPRRARKPSRGSRRPAPPPASDPRPRGGDTSDDETIAQPRPARPGRR